MTWAVLHGAFPDIPGLKEKEAQSTAIGAARPCERELPLKAPDKPDTVHRRASSNAYRKKGPSSRRLSPHLIRRPIVSPELVGHPSPAAAYMTCSVAKEGQSIARDHQAQHVRKWYSMQATGRCSTSLRCAASCRASSGTGHEGATGCRFRTPLLHHQHHTQLGRTCMSYCSEMHFGLCR